jgi:phenylacetate-coenzyme A ligase PaaK-like adenylate-forming protein
MLPPAGLLFLARPQIQTAIVANNLNNFKNAGIDSPGREYYHGFFNALAFAAGKMKTESKISAGNMDTPPPAPWPARYRQFSLKSLETALAEVPGYGSWRSFDLGGRAPLDERYAALPALTKSDLRAHFPDGFIPRGRDLEQGLSSGEVEFAQTSGSPEDRVKLVFNRSWWEASERAAWELNRHVRAVADGCHREVVLASPRCVGPGFSDEPLTVAERTIGRHLYVNQKINPVSWTAADVRRMAQEINDHQPLALEGDPAYLAAFARRIAGSGIAIFQPRLIFLTYSFPSRLYLRQIGNVFTAPLISSYGSTETGHVFMECEAGRLHQNSEHCRVDFVPWLARHGGPRRGRMLVTVFHNPWFAVLRFDIGDVACLDERGPCPCGREQGLTLAAIDGRVADVTFSGSGRAVTVDDLDARLAGISRLDAWQLDLPRPGALHLRILAGPGAAAPVCRDCRERLRDLYGKSFQIEVAAAKALEHEVSGKIRFTRTAFPVDHTVLWRAGGENGPS